MLLYFTCTKNKFTKRRCNDAVSSMIKGICVSYLLGLSYIDLRTIRYVTQINLGIKVAVLFYSPRSFHTKEDFF